jgi:hypothetical protein
MAMTAVQLAAICATLDECGLPSIADLVIGLLSNAELALHPQTAALVAKTREIAQLLDAQEGSGMGEWARDATIARCQQDITDPVTTRKSDPWNVDASHPKMEKLETWKMSDHIARMSKRPYLWSVVAGLLSMPEELDEGTEDHDNEDEILGVDGEDAVDEDEPDPGAAASGGPDGAQSAAPRRKRTAMTEAQKRARRVAVRELVRPPLLCTTRC